ncbi:class I SAM-dependent methyltransferase [Myxococcota bacterium]|nr:class I SAM-dependent methyltransferase [Myxococcota bacterium]
MKFLILFTIFFTVSCSDGKKQATETKSKTVEVKSEHCGKHDGNHKTGHCGKHDHNGNHKIEAKHKHQSDKPKHGHINCPHAGKKNLSEHDSHRPVRKTEDYIKLLENPDRDKWQKPEDVIKALSLKGNEIITEIGAGAGYFSLRFAAKLKNGSVEATDIDGEMIAHIKKRAVERNIKNIKAFVADGAKPDINPNSDLVFMKDVLHHVQKRDIMLSHLFSKMKSSSRLVILEFKMGKLPSGPPDSLKIPEKDIISMVTKAGFKFVYNKKTILPYHEFLIFTK